MARELMVFTKAFFKEKLFNHTVFHKLKVNNRLKVSMLPIHYGSGFMRIPLNGLATLFMGKGKLIGHSGSTGSFAFYNPEKGMFFYWRCQSNRNPRDSCKASDATCYVYEILKMKVSSINE
ncbi:hypothetical protein [Oceanobacillus senegalensis]|uniref:hypothetical protein n=1 Tax=Oceanobacillus senegalensis TaxID=1936063 RepID=UPI000A30FDA5|nr:hypothetical protein [Oceanobacillus senegalensis]